MMKVNFRLPKQANPVILTVLVALGIASPAFTQRESVNRSDAVSGSQSKIVDALPDGSVRLTADIVEYDDQNWRNAAYNLNFETANSRGVLVPSVSAYGARLSPDGKWAAYIVVESYITESAPDGGPAQARLLRNSILNVRSLDNPSVHWRAPHVREGFSWHPREPKIVYGRATQPVDRPLEMPNLYVMDVTSGAETLLLERASNPRFSPDGARLFYHRREPIHGGHRLRPTLREIATGSEVDVDTDQKLGLVDYPGLIDPNIVDIWTDSDILVWRFDDYFKKSCYLGTWAFNISKNRHWKISDTSGLLRPLKNGAEIEIISDDGSSIIVNLAASEKAAESPRHVFATSPDGSGVLIADLYDAGDPEGEDAWNLIYENTQTGARRVIESGLRARGPKFSPDGQYISYRQVTENGCADDYMSYGARPRVLSVADEAFDLIGSQCGSPLWSPNSQSLVYRGCPLAGQGSAESCSIRLLHLPSREEQVIEPDSGRIGTFSPDGSMLLYQRHSRETVPPGAPWRLWDINANREITLFPPGTAYDEDWNYIGSEPLWAPNDRIVWTTYEWTWALDRKAGRVWKLGNVAGTLEWESPGHKVIVKPERGEPVILELDAAVQN